MHWIAVGGAVRVDFACASKEFSKNLPAMHGKGRGWRTWRAVATNNAKQAAVSIQRPVARRLFVELHDGCFRIRRLVQQSRFALKAPAVSGAALRNSIPRTRGSCKLNIIAPREVGSDESCELGGTGKPRV